MILVRKIRNHATYANVMATLALFVALGGGAYAALKIDSGDVQNHSIKGIDVAKNTLGGAQVKESKLGKVPSASSAENAEAIQGTGLNALKVHCPPDTDAHAGICFEKGRRSEPFGPYLNAVRDCGTDQRRLPTAAELASYLTEPGQGDATGDELTSDLVLDREQQLHVLRLFDTSDDRVFVLTEEVGFELAESVIQNYRCVALPSN